MKLTHLAEFGAVERAINQNDVVVVGMTQIPSPKKARKLRDATSVPYEYLEYGSYFIPGGAGMPSRCGLAGRHFP